MALVLLPCDLPTWPSVQRHLNQLKLSENSSQLVEGMLKLYTICCISLDPDEDKRDPCLFDGLQQFLDEVLNVHQRTHFYEKTLSSIVKHALALKLCKPIDGLQYSLQQQGECLELDKKLIASILANAFFSTFPKRTVKTHPTLQDCNFSNFFQHLARPTQRIKLMCFLNYFDKIADEETRGKISVTRQVTLKKDLLTMDDWLGCDLPLCPVTVRHDGRIEHADTGNFQVCFSSARIGGDVLEGGYGQEAMVLFAFPELLVVLCCVEALEDNESLAIRGFAIINRLHGNGSDVRIDENFHPDGSLDPSENHICLMDAIDYKEKPLRQYYTSNIARELNKASIGFRQKESSIRLPPIGQSCSSTPPEERKQYPDEEAYNDQFQNQDKSPPSGISAMSIKSLFGKKDGLSSLVGSLLRKPQDTTVFNAQETSRRGSAITGSSGEEITVTARRLPTPPKQERNKFPQDTSSSENVVLEKDGSCGEADENVYKDCVEWLPQTTVSTNPSALRPLRLVPYSAENCQLMRQKQKHASFLSANSNVKSDSEDSDEEHFSSCTEDIEEDEEKPEVQHNPKAPVVPRRAIVASAGYWRYESSLDMNRDTQVSSPGGHPDDPEDEMLELRRSGSTGFLLEEEDDDYFPGDSLEYGQEWLHQFRHKTINPSRSVSRRNSSRYSFSSDFSSDLEDIYEHFEEKMAQGAALDDPEMASRCRVYGRGGPNLKRTLSDSMTSLPAHERGEGLQFARSLSLTDRLQQERTDMDRAKRYLEHTKDSDEDGSQDALPGKWRWVGTPVNIEQNLTQSHQCLVIPPPGHVVAHINKLTKHPSQLSVWWNYNDTYEFSVPLRKYGQAKPNRLSVPASSRTWHTMPCRLVPIPESPMGTSPTTTPNSLSDARLLSRSVSAKEISYSNQDKEQYKIPIKDPANLDINMLQKDASGRNLRKWHATLHLNDSSGDEREILGSVAKSGSKISDDLHNSHPKQHHHHRMGNFQKEEIQPGALTSRLDREDFGERIHDSHKECDAGRIIVTGNWGCGKRKASAQLKAMIQWLAASRVRCPCMVYYTSGEESVVKLNVVCRILLDRHWSVSHLARAVLKYSQNIDYRSKTPCETDLFDELLPKETDL